jgi:hypothetical protein
MKIKPDSLSDVLVSVGKSRYGTDSTYRTGQDRTVKNNVAIQDSSVQSSVMQNIMIQDNAVQ